MIAIMLIGGLTLLVAVCVADLSKIESVRRRASELRALI
jgi:hypothetical protein